MLGKYKAFKIGLILVSAPCLLQQAMALGLGELAIESSLTEPLDATIELLDVAGLDPAQISISLGTEQDYASVGAELVPAVSQVQFEVAVDGATGSIHLTTPNNVEEPFLDLILNVRWPDGMVRREYTVLLDLPGTVSTTIDPLIMPATTNSSPPAVEEPPGFPADNSEDSLNTDGQEYTVADGDSMWEIAARTRPSSDVSMQQMMLAIQRANENAFINNNINRVLSGKVLRIPTLQEIQLVDQDSAIARISQQNQELGVQPLAVNRTTGNNSTTPPQDELTVLTDDQSSAAAAGNTDLDATLVALENEMMMSEESLDRARLENAELTSRFKMLEEEMDLLQNLISMEDARIAQLQAELTAQAETTEEALATTEEATNVLAAQQPESPQGMVGSVSGWLQNTAVMLGVIVALFLLILGYLFWQRRRMTAAVYAFDSGIPELETVGNSSFVPAEKTGGGLMGWFSSLGRKNKNEDNEMDFVAVSGGAAAGTMSLRSTTPVQPADVHGTIDLDETAETSLYLDEEQMINAANQAEAGRISGRDEVPGGVASSHQGDTSAHITQTTRTEEDDEADLADALIAEARGFGNSADESPDRRAVSIHEHAATELTETEAEEEAEALAKLVTPDVAITESAIPESFEFTLTSTPEALSEKTSIEIPDEDESFDFQLSEPGAVENEITAPGSSAEHEMSDEELQLSTMLLDEEAGDIESVPMNECDTKLDLAVAYEAMGDTEGAIEILSEVLADGNSTQIAEANRLKGLWQTS